jgi:hypothetical protein
MAVSLIRGCCRIDVLALAHQLQRTVDAYYAVHAVAESCNAALSCLGDPPYNGTAAGVRVALGYRWPDLQHAICIQNLTLYMPQNMQSSPLYMARNMQSKVTLYMACTPVDACCCY